MTLKAVQFLALVLTALALKYMVKRCRLHSYGVYHDLDAWRRYMSVAGFVELSHYYRPAGVPRERQPWLASVWRRLAS
jgi:hypothetical protein